MNSEEKLLIARTEDLFAMCEKYCSPVFSDFFDGAQQTLIKDNIKFPYGCKVMTYGGFEDAEKKIIGIFPDWAEPDTSEFPIECLKVEGGFTRKLNHRDYLGTVMSLGIKPAKLGDIVVSDHFAFIFLHSDISGYVKDNLHKIGNQGVTVTKISSSDTIKIERKYKSIGAVCASYRLDAVVGAAANVSRSASAALINGGKVKLNHRETTKISETVKEGDLLSLRGYGRFLVFSFDGETRKNRLHITLKQYI